jgi:hypothetical protein
MAKSDLLFVIGDVVVAVVETAIQNKCDKYNSFQFYFNVWLGL